MEGALQASWLDPQSLSHWFEETGAVPSGQQQLHNLALGSVDVGGQDAARQAGDAGLVGAADEARARQIEPLLTEQFALEGVVVPLDADLETIPRFAAFGALIPVGGLSFDVVEDSRVARTEVFTVTGKPQELR